MAIRRDIALITSVKMNFEYATIERRTTGKTTRNMQQNMAHCQSVPQGMP